MPPSRHNAEFSETGLQLFKRLLSKLRSFTATEVTVLSLTVGVLLLCIWGLRSAMVDTDSLSNSGMRDNPAAYSGHARQYPGRSAVSASLRREAMFLGERLQQYTLINGLPDWYLYHAVLIGNCDSAETAAPDIFPQFVTAVARAWKLKHVGIEKREPHIGQFASYLLMAEITDEEFLTASGGQLTRSDLLKSAQEAAIVDGDLSWLVAAIAVGGNRNPDFQNKYGEVVRVNDLFSHLVTNASPYCFGLHRRLAMALMISERVTAQDSMVGQIAVEELSVAASLDLPQFKDVPALIMSIEPKLQKVSENELESAALRYLGHEVHWRAVFREHAESPAGFESASEDCLRVVAKFVERLETEKDHRSVLKGDQRAMFGAACHAVAAITWIIRHDAHGSD